MARQYIEAAYDINGGVNISLIGVINGNRTNEAMAATCGYKLAGEWRGV